MANATMTMQEKAIRMADAIAKREGEAVVTRTEFLPNSRRFGEPDVFIAQVWTSQFGRNAEVGAVDETPFLRATLVYKTKS